MRLQTYHDQIDGITPYFKDHPMAEGSTAVSCRGRGWFIFGGCGSISEAKATSKQHQSNHGWLSCPHSIICAGMELTCCSFWFCLPFFHDPVFPHAERGI